MTMPHETESAINRARAYLEKSGSAEVAQILRHFPGAAEAAWLTSARGEVESAEKHAGSGFCETCHNQYSAAQAALASSAGSALLAWSREAAEWLAPGGRGTTQDSDAELQDALVERARTLGLLPKEEKA